MQEICQGYMVLQRLQVFILHCLLGYNVPPPTATKEGTWGDPPREDQSHDSREGPEGYVPACG